MSLFKKITLSVITSAAMLTTTNATAQTTLFDTPFDATYNNTTLKMPYRIPALVETENATTGNKELIFFGDKRYCGMDIGYGSSASAFGSTNNDYYRIDIVCKRSTDGGKSWGAETIVKQGTATCGYGDIAVVSNRVDQKEIVAFAATGNVRYSNTSSNIQITRLYSDNGGQSWTSSDYTSKIYGIYSSGYGRFFTSGRICQSKQIKVGDYYRLYAALCVWNGSNSSNALVIYSDDFGSSWNVLGSGYAVSGGDESKVEELPNGNVLISSRIYSGYDSNGRRRFNVFKYNSLPTTANTASGSWGTVYSGIQYTGTTKPCNGEILLVPAKDTNGNSCNILLHSEPYGTTEAEGRGNVSIFWKVLSSDKITSASEFAGTNWNRFPVSTTTSAYSTMIQQHDGTIAFAYEETIWGNGSGAPSTSIDKIKWGEHGYDLKYQNFTIAEITSNKYSYCAGEEETPVVETVATPVISVSNSNYSATFSIACSTADATIYYTTDGTMPTTSSTKYTGTVTLSTPGTYTVKAIAVKDGCNDSEVATSDSFTINKEVTEEPEEEEGEVVTKVATPYLTIASGEVEAGTQLTIKCATEGATIYYTTDGTTPSATNGTVYTSAITINATMTLKAIAIKDGCEDSHVVTTTYIVTENEEVEWALSSISCGRCNKYTYSTLYLDYGIEIPSTVKAYRAVYNSTTGILTLYRLRYNKIPALYPVILKDTKARTSVTFTKSDYTYNPGQNDLEGTLVNMTIDNTDDYYIYGHSSSGHMGFYHPSSTVMKANKAFLPRPAGSSEIKVRFEDEDATGIGDIFTEENDDAPIYDLTGRKVNDTSKPGIYIKNGKKYIVR